MKEIIINDTASNSDYLGYQLVMQNKNYLCDRHNINIILSVKNNNSNDELFLRNRYKS